jgi:hypothetical protein
MSSFLEQQNTANPATNVQETYQNRYTADYLVEQDYNVQFLNNVIINKTNVLLPQA